MPIHVSCPSCRGEFNAPDTAAGKRAKCPTCGGVIDIRAAAPAAVMVEAGPASAESDDEFGAQAPAELLDGEERKQCPMCGETIAAQAIKCRFCGEILDPSMKGMIGAHMGASDPGWRRVRTGLATLYYCIAIIFIAAIVMGIGMMTIFAAGGNGGGPLPVLAMIIMGIGGLVILGAAIGSLVGQILCISVPESSGARGLMIGSLVCTLVNFPLSFIGGAVDSPAISGLGSLISVAGSVLFVLFIRQAATYLSDQELAASALRFLFFGIAVFVGIVMLAIVSSVGAGNAGVPIVIAILGLAAIVCGIVYLVWYLRLIHSLMTTIDHRTGTR